MNAMNKKAKLTEKILDKALENAFRKSPEFCQWFLGRTKKFSDRNATYHWSRSNHPWGTVPITGKNPETGIEETIKRQSETDVLVVFESQGGKRIALHIENKLNANFTEFQVQDYPTRAAHWVGKSKYRNYLEFDTVLIAPSSYLQKHQTEAKHFGCCISHEEIAEHLPIFHGYFVRN